VLHVLDPFVVAVFAVSPFRGGRSTQQA
jgi:hypothetical protein